MKKINTLFAQLFSFIFILLFTGSLQAQVRGNGVIKEQTRALSGFSAISSTGSVDIFVKQGNTYSVVVRADGNLLNDIKTQVKNNMLIISVTKNIWRAKVLEVHVTMKTLKKVTLSGSGDFYCKSPFTVEDFQLILTDSGDAEANLNAKNAQIRVKGSGDVDVTGIHGTLDIEMSGSGDLEADRLQLETCSLKISGSGDAELKGRTVQLKAVVYGSGDVEAGKLTAVNANVNLNGSGDMSIHAIDKLEATVSGSGDFGYSGNPSVLKINTLGSGDIYKK